MNSKNTVIQCHVICRDLSGQPYPRWLDILSDQDVHWQDIIIDVQELMRIAYPQFELLSIKMKDLVTLAMFEHQWVEVEIPLGNGMFAMPLSALMNNHREPTETNLQPPGQYV